MTRPLCCVLVAWLGLAGVALRAADTPANPEAAGGSAPDAVAGRGAMRGDTMQYGSLLSYSICNTAPATRGAELTYEKPDGFDALVNKGITLRLDHDVYATFDTETGRIAAAWVAPPPGPNAGSPGFPGLDLRSTNLCNDKGKIPAVIKGDILFTTAPGPGWANPADGSFKDPRQRIAGAPVDNLPREWFHYKGLYRHGEQTVLSYTVGDTDVLELMEAEETGGGAVSLLRTMLIGATKHPLDLLAANNASVVALRALRPEVASVVQNGSTAVVHINPHAEPITIQVVAGGRMLPSYALDQTLSNIAAATLPAAAMWPKTTVSHVTRLGKPFEGYTVDALGFPEGNAYGSLMRMTALDFFPDGKRFVVTTWNGDVWIGTMKGPMGGDDETVTWRRFAAGLYEPLGVKVIHGEVYVRGRDQITILHDRNGDGEADWYENFNSDGPTSPAYHSFKYHVLADHAGNIYYTTTGNGIPGGYEGYASLIKVSPDGVKSEVVATGLRAPNGATIREDETTGGPLISVSDNQGHWTPTSKINMIRPGGYYGYPGDPAPFSGSKAARLTPEQIASAPRTYDQPMIWIPYNLDSSSGGEAWAAGPGGDDRWGPLKATMLHTSYGKSALFVILPEKIDGPGGQRWQAAGYQLPLDFTTGIMRAVFNDGPTPGGGDGQLYVTGLHGWQTNRNTEGGVYRVRCPGVSTNVESTHLPIAFHVGAHSIAITFSAPLDRTTAQDTDSFDVQQWHYKYGPDYGSDNYSYLDNKPLPKGKGDPVTVKAAHLSADGKTITLDIPDLKPVEQMTIDLMVKASDGTVVRLQLFNTIHALGKD